MLNTCTIKCIRILLCFAGIGSCSAAISTDHNDVTLSLAKKESAEHFHGMQELYETMRLRPLRVKAVPLGKDFVKTNAFRKAKVVHFIRHGQGFHNLMADMYHGAGREWTQYQKSENNPYVIPEILDSPLTEKGRRQAELLQQSVVAFENQPQLVVLSPNCRALQTGIIVFNHLVQHDKIPFIAHEMVREETGVHVCDKRRSITRQMREFPMVDFSLISDDEDLIFNEYRRETKMEIGERIYNFFEFLYERDEEHVGIASHSGWLMTLFNGLCECSEDNLKEWFQTGEMRSVQLIFEYYD